MSTLPEIFAEYAALRSKRLALQKEVDAMKAKEDQLSADMQIMMMGKKLKEVTFPGGKAVLKPRQKFVVKDWTAFYDYIVSHGTPFMLEKRPAQSSINEVYQAGEQVDGIDRQTFEDIVISVAKE